MIGLLLLAIIATIGGWFAWLYLVSPRSDRERIEADQGGTGALTFTIKRTGTRYQRAEVGWVADNLVHVGGGGWRRIYQVTVERAGGPSETYSVAVEAKLFGLSDLKRIDPRAGE